VIDDDLPIGPARAGWNGPRDLGAGAIEALTVHLCAEQRMAGWYTAFSARALEPELGRIFAALAGDASHRAAACAAQLRRAVQRDPCVLPAVLRMALWITRNGEVDAEHPRAPSGRPVPPPGGDRHCIGRMLDLYRVLLPDPGRAAGAPRGTEPGVAGIAALTGVGAG